jgi:hypothetical protein
VKMLMNNITEGTILNEKFKGKGALLPRIPMIPTDIVLEFKLCSFLCDSLLQWPSTKHKDNRYRSVWTEFEKSMLLTWTTLYIYLYTYMACSRIGKPSNLYVHAPEGRTKNIVCPNGLQQISSMNIELSR